MAKNTGETQKLTRLPGPPDNLPNPARPSRSIKAILDPQDRLGPLDTTKTY
jgi:hypothetical protein